MINLAGDGGINPLLNYSLDFSEVQSSEAQPHNFLACKFKSHLAHITFKETDQTFKETDEMISIYYNSITSTDSGRAVVSYCHQKRWHVPQPKASMVSRRLD